MRFYGKLAYVRRKNVFRLDLLFENECALQQSEFLICFCKSQPAFRLLVCVLCALPCWVVVVPSWRRRHPPIRSGWHVSTFRTTTPGITTTLRIRVQALLRTGLDVVVKYNCQYPINGIPLVFFATFGYSADPTHRDHPPTLCMLSYDLRQCIQLIHPHCVCYALRQCSCGVYVDAPWNCCCLV